jgi:hypothetical protein
MHRFLRLVSTAVLWMIITPGIVSIRDVSVRTFFASNAAYAQPAATDVDIPLIELYPFPVWYQRFEAGEQREPGAPDDRLIVLDPLSGRVSRFENLHFVNYPTFHRESLGGVLHLRLEGADDRQTAFKRWYVNPATGKTSEVLSPTGEAQSDQLLQCDGQQRQHWVALGDRLEMNYGVVLFDTRLMKSLTDWETPTARLPLPPTRIPWRTCHHQHWMVAYQRNALYVYDPVAQKRFSQSMPEGVVAEPLNIIFRDQKLWVWWRLQQQVTGGVNYALWHFDLATRAWHNYPEQTLPFLPLQDFAEHELLLGPPWLPSDYRAPYFRLNTLTGRQSAPIWVRNEAPGKLANLSEVWRLLTGPISE